MHTGFLSSLDPEDPKLTPLGLTLCEAYCLFHGMLNAVECAGGAGARLFFERM